MRIFQNSVIPAIVCVMLAPAAIAQIPSSQEYQDGARGTVILPQGERSFADVVVNYAPGSGTIVPGARNPEKALGAPDFSGVVTDGSFVSLGCNGTLTLRFTDNALIDIDGPDLYVFEVGPNVEGMFLAISEDGDTWIEIGEISGGRAEVDIHDFVPVDSSFRYVRLTDDGIDCGTNYAGADIDAVAAIGSAMRFVLEGSVLFEHDSSGLRNEARLALDDFANQIAAARVARLTVIGHTDSTGSDSYNLSLSEARAAAVRDYLSTQTVLDGVTIMSTGRGESEPIASNQTEEGRSQNRRVEFVAQ